jgi:hypothetical protein
MEKTAQRSGENLCNLVNPRRESARAFDQRRFVTLRMRRIYRTERKKLPDGSTPCVAEAARVY